jgi:hypothetical protein
LPSQFIVSSNASFILLINEERRPSRTPFKKLILNYISNLVEDVPKTQRSVEDVSES